MLSASAQGVRKMPSKLRYVLQDFSYIHVDLVRGKDFWRITSASKTNALENISRQPETRAVFAHIARLLTRLLAGEEANEILFADLLSGLSILEKSNTNEALRNIETILVLRILYHLGYIGGAENLNDLIKSPFEADLVFQVTKNRAGILAEINKALKETHL